MATPADQISWAPLIFLLRPPLPGMRSAAPRTSLTASIHPRPGRFLASSSLCHNASLPLPAAETTQAVRRFQPTGGNKVAGDDFSLTRYKDSDHMSESLPES